MRVYRIGHQRAQHRAWHTVGLRKENSAVPSAPKRLSKQPSSPLAKTAFLFHSDTQASLPYTWKFGAIDMKGLITT